MLSLVGKIWWKPKVSKLCHTSTIVKSLIPLSNEKIRTLETQDTGVLGSEGWGDKARMVGEWEVELSSCKQVMLSTWYMLSRSLEDINFNVCFWFTNCNKNFTQKMKDIYAQADET